MFKNPVVHAILSFAIFAIPFGLSHFPAIADLTIGGVLTGLLHYIEAKINETPSTS